jgi:hypothetical protein
MSKSEIRLSTRGAIHSFQEQLYENGLNHDQLVNTSTNCGNVKTFGRDSVDIDNLWKDIFTTSEDISLHEPLLSP